jgi:hypothetical protein
MMPSLFIVQGSDLDTVSISGLSQAVVVKGERCVLRHSNETDRLLMYKDGRTGKENSGF